MGFGAVPTGHHVHRDHLKSWTTTAMPLLHKVIDDNDFYLTASPQPIVGMYSVAEFLRFVEVQANRLGVHARVKIIWEDH